ncbi:peptidoglycan-binding protein [Streptomyces sp. NPDC059072]|uniref:peptidoglycan-binding protein n=1 Tax=Streptomyces sp. NPDC059072 TaxID=3346715 RepID=UPI0036AE25B4
MEQIMRWAEVEDMEAGDVISILAIDHVFYESVMRTGGSASWNNQNPGNIVRSGEAESYGAYAGKANDIFAIFPSEATGFAAIRKFLLKRRDKTIRQMMDIYAPLGHGPNNPEEYARQIAQALGVDVSVTVAELNDGQLEIFAKKIRQIEGWALGVAYGPETLPKDVVDWLTEHPTRAERRAADQPLAKKGSVSEGIKNIQRILNDLGWTPALVVDGNFGPKTESAVKWFQWTNGLVADGIVGNKTWQKLTASTALAADEADYTGFRTVVDVVSNELSNTIAEILRKLKDPHSFEATVRHLADRQGVSRTVDDAGSLYDAFWNTATGLQAQISWSNAVGVPERSRAYVEQIKPMPAYIPSRDGYGASGRSWLPALAVSVATVF